MQPAGSGWDDVEMSVPPTVAVDKKQLTAPAAEEPAPEPEVDAEAEPETKPKGRGKAKGGRKRSASRGKSPKKVKKDRSAADAPGAVDAEAEDEAFQPRAWSPAAVDYEAD